MTGNDDFEYYSRRAEAERELSRTSRDPATAQIHAKLAERYERLMKEQGRARPTLRIVTP